MIRLIKVAVRAGLLAAVIAACGPASVAAGGPASSGGAAGGTHSPGGPAGGTHSPGSPGRCGAHVVAGDAASGTTICVALGSDLTVMLRNPPGTGWSSPHLTGAALGPGAPIPTPSQYVGWAFRAVAAGLAEISLTRPACPPASPGAVSCAALVLYHLHVRVR